MNNKRFFVLNPDCFLVKGVSRGAIYDLKSGNVYSVDGLSMKIIESLDLGGEFSQVLNLDKSLNSKDVLSYLDGLCEKGLGRWEKVFTAKVPTAIPAMNEILKYTLHLELTNNCNLRCVHCFNESGVTKANLKNEPSLNQWENAIKDAYSMNCRRVQFIGGEPFLRRRLMFKLISFARDVGYKSLEISSNGTLMSDSDFKVLKEYDVNLALSFYSHQPQIHDLITTRNGSWERTLRIIKKALKFDIGLRISIVAMKQNEQDTKQTEAFLKSLGVKNVKSTTIEPAGRGCDENLTPVDICKKQVRSRPYFAKTYQNIFLRNKTGHNCFLEQICVGADGSVYPCLAERKVSYGNIRFNSLNEILLSETAQKFRHLNKNHIDVCRDCEYRYCCFDCRVRAKDYLGGNDFHAKPWWCTYNPYTGKWNQK